MLNDFKSNRDQPAADTDGALTALCESFALMGSVPGFVGGGRASEGRGETTARLPSSRNAWYEPVPGMIPGMISKSSKYTLIKK